MFDWLKRKAIDKSRSNISVIVGNIAYILDQLANATGGRLAWPLPSPKARQILQEQQKELLFQLNGPIPTSAVRELVEELTAEKPHGQYTRLIALEAIDAYDRANSTSGPKAGPSSGSR